jgi:hypothetical protein
MICLRWYPPYLMTKKTRNPCGVSLIDVFREVTRMFKVYKVWKVILSWQITTAGQEFIYKFFINITHKPKSAISHICTLGSFSLLPLVFLLYPHIKRFHASKHNLTVTLQTSLTAALTEGLVRHFALMIPLFCYVLGMGYARMANARMSASASHKPTELVLASECSENL